MAETADRVADFVHDQRQRLVDAGVLHDASLAPPNPVKAKEKENREDAPLFRLSHAKQSVPFAQQTRRLRQSLLTSTTAKTGTDVPLAQQPHEKPLSAEAIAKVIRQAERRARRKVSGAELLRRDQRAQRQKADDNEKKEKGIKPKTKASCQANHPRPSEDTSLTSRLAGPVGAHRLSTKLANDETERLVGKRDLSLGYRLGFDHDRFFQTTSADTTTNTKEGSKEKITREDVPQIDLTRAASAQNTVTAHPTANIMARMSRAPSPDLVILDHVAEEKEETPERRKTTSEVSSSVDYDRLQDEVEALAYDTPYGTLTATHAAQSCAWTQWTHSASQPTSYHYASPLSVLFRQEPSLSFPRDNRVYEAEERMYGKVEEKYHPVVW